MALVPSSIVIPSQKKHSPLPSRPGVDISPREEEETSPPRRHASKNPSASKQAIGRQRPQFLAQRGPGPARRHGEPRPRLLLLRVPTAPANLLRRPLPEAARLRAAADGGGGVHRRCRAERAQEAQALRRRRRGSSRIRER